MVTVQVLLWIVYQPDAFFEECVIQAAVLLWLQHPSPIKSERWGGFFRHTPYCCLGITFIDQCLEIDRRSWEAQALGGSNLRSESWISLPRVQRIGTE